ncbi:MAG TPA: class I SAM-dependent methyltransferase [Solirubrobacteraceae bacterium]|nr:class I SAM-dependent methyltransferase [Solirubrobacteraceae bacterium]
MIPYRLMYRLGFAPWERRDVAESWQPILDGPDAPAPGRALDLGCGSGSDAVYLAKRGWRVTAVDFADAALAKAQRRATDEGVEVQWIRGDVARLGQLGLEPGYSLLYDFGCIQGLPASARAGAVLGLTELAAPGATLLMLAFKASIVTEDMPPLVRRAVPTIYRLTRRSKTDPSSLPPVG